MVTSKTDRHNESTCGCCCCQCLFVLFTVIGIFGIIQWLSLRPHNPDFIISRANFPVQNKTSMIFDLEFYNPNVHTRIYFSVINLELLGADGDVAGTNFTPGFHLEGKNETLKIVLNAGQKFWQAGDVDFMVRVKSDVKFRIKGPFMTKAIMTKARRVIYEERFRYVNNKN